MKKSAAVTWENRAVDRIQNHSPDLPYTDLDREIWQNELESFVPHRIFDAHTHFWSNDFVLPETVCSSDWLQHETDGKILQRLSSVLYPGRECDFLTFAQPVVGADYDRLNRWVASEAKAFSGQSRTAMLISRETPAGVIDSMVRECGFAALKPYYLSALPCAKGIRSYFTPEQMDVADGLNLAVVLHCRSGIAEDVEELLQYTVRFPHIRWILAHCGAAYNPKGISSAIRRLADRPGIWFDTSGICETYPQAVLLKYFDRKRILFGSDNALGTGGCRRGRVTAYANSVLWFKQTEHATFWLYEQLRAMQRACELMELSASETEDIFYRNAVRLFGLE